MTRHHKHNAFTLSELLIALAVLGVIATFTIPKVLQSQRVSAWNASAKEAAAAISEAYTVYKKTNIPTAATQFNHLTPYLNYVRVDTTSSMDRAQGVAGPLDCASNLCLQMHNGGVLWGDYVAFGGTATTNAIYIPFDPDGKYSGSPTGDGKAIGIYLYFNGRVTTADGIDASTCTSYGCWGPIPSQIPPWFSWSS